MSRLRIVIMGVWGFLVGDDWRIALGVCLALALTASVAAAGVPAWWLMPIAVPLLLRLSLRFRGD